MSQLNIADILALGPIIPVATVKRLDEAVPMARRLLARGIRSIEVTLRTPVALDAMRLIRQEVSEITVGAGTITSVESFDVAVDAGAAFLVSPGSTEALLTHAAASAAPFLPGAATVSDVMRAVEHGFRHLKFFPAELAGGIPMLKHLGALFPGLIFCPTGGIHAGNMQAYLDLPHVACVGGSWVAT